MVNIFLPKDSAPFYNRYLLFLTGTILLTLVSAISSFLLFPLQSGLISVFFASFSLIASMELILEKNKNDIWQRKTNPFVANLDMAMSLIVIFIAALAAYCFAVFVIPNDMLEIVFFSQIHDTMTHTHLVNKDFSSILTKRLTVCLIFFVVSLIYRVGSVFVLVWIASIWGVVYGIFLKQGFHLDLPAIKHYESLISFSGFGILVIRTFSFITACMAGVFLSKAISKYSPKSPEFKQVFRAVLVILVVSLALLTCSTYLEFLNYKI